MAFLKPGRAAILLGLAATAKWIFTCRFIVCWVKLRFLSHMRRQNGRLHGVARVRLPSLVGGQDRLLHHVLRLLSSLLHFRLAHIRCRRLGPCIVLVLLAVGFLGWLPGLKLLGVAARIGASLSRVIAVGGLLHCSRRGLVLSQMRPHWGRAQRCLVYRL